jgi:segregation and condensation protein A
VSPLPGAETAEFNVHLSNFTGPFDLLLQLISKHKLDVTEVALSRVTDDFVAHIKLATAVNGPGWWDLDQQSSFIVVASTLLDLKAARLLPQGEVDDLEDLALLEARDLLFARLLQYRAYKQAAGLLEVLLARQSLMHPRLSALEPPFDQLVPEVVLDLDVQAFALLAARALTPREPPTVAVDHVHAPMVSVPQQAQILRERLPGLGRATFRSLVADCTGTLEVVGRFLALLELYRDGSVLFDQVDPLGELLVRWTGDAAAAEGTSAGDLAERPAADEPRAPGGPDEDEVDEA